MGVWERGNEGRKGRIRREVRGEERGEGEEAVRKCIRKERSGISSAVGERLSVEVQLTNGAQVEAMDLDVFGSSESKVVFFGADNVVIVKEKATDEEAKNEEETIPEIISELKIDANDTSSTEESIIKREELDSSSASLDIDEADAEAPEVKVVRGRMLVGNSFEFTLYFNKEKEETTSPKPKPGRLKRKEPVKEEPEADEHRSLRSSRAKVVNYDDTKDDKVIEEATKPKVSRKKELEAEQGTVYFIIYI